MCQNKKQASDSKIAVNNSDVASFFTGRNVFITGATGFLGKILVEKLLRYCPDVEGLFLLVREKKGKDMYSRVEDYTSDPIFDKLKEEQPKFTQKITGIKGDVGMIALGLSQNDQQMLFDKVSVIFHVAATVRFDEKINTAVAINVRGTKEVIDFAKQCPLLVSMMHVSTAFSHCPRCFVEERFYPSPYDPQKLLNIVEDTSENLLKDITKELLGNWPNTYSFTKAVAEEVVRLNGPGLPICVFRPAIVTAVNEEPIPGWIDNINGPSGMAAGTGCGVLRTARVDPNCIAECVPVDLVVNAMIVASYKNANRKEDKIPIYNYVSSPENPLTWRDVCSSSLKYGDEVPSEKCVWYYCFYMIKNKYLYSVAAIFLHIIPALLIDTALLLMGKKPQFLKVYKKVGKFVDVIAYFATREWEFTNDNVRKLWENTSETDKQLFPFNISRVNWDIYHKHQVYGIRKYVLKEDISTVPAARIKYRRLYYLHRAFQILLAVLLINLVYMVYKKLF